MNTATWILIGLGVVLMFIAYQRGDGSLEQGFRTSWQALVNLLPLLLAIFVVIGFSEVLLPQQLIASWLGSQSGMKGILIASGVGALTPGGPFVSFPLVGALYRAGAGIGPVVAFVTAWSLWAVSRLPMEMALVGPRVTLIRLASSILFPPLAGLIASVFFERFA